MTHLVQYTSQMRDYYVRKREGETKIGEEFQLLKEGLPLQEGLAICSARYVLLGLPEDLGVRANFGRGGAHTAWQPSLSFFANVQRNRFLDGKDILLLGHINFDDLLQKAKDLKLADKAQHQQLTDLVAEVDARVWPVIQAIVASNKIPIVIGGGHNNAYGMLRGSSLALQKSINTLNIDAHTDLRKTEGRHSGNGFSYALQEGFLNNYFMHGIHQSYTPENIFAWIDGQPNIEYNLFDDIEILHPQDSWQDFLRGLNFVSTDSFGLELDMDAIQNIPASARTSSGFSANQVRQMVSEAGQQKNICYLHICEAAPTLTHKDADVKTGKLISYFIADFIKANKKIAL